MYQFRKLCALALAFHSASAFAVVTEFSSTYEVTQSIRANEAVFDAASQTIFLTAPSNNSAIGSLTRLDLSGNILSSTIIGATPTVLAVSSGGDKAYVGYAGLNGNAAVMPVDVNTGQTEAPIDVGRFYGLGRSKPLAIAVAPSDANTIAVSTQFPFRISLATTYTNGKVNEASEVIDNGSNISSITFDPNGTRAFASSLEGNVYSMDFDGRNFSNVQSIFGGAGINLTVHNELLYTSNGLVYDPSLQAVVGSYTPAPSAVTIDQRRQLVFGWLYNGDITVYNLETFTPITTLHTGLNIRALKDVMDLGNGNFALLGSSDLVAYNLFYLQAIPEPSSPLLMALGMVALTLAYRKRGA